MVVGHSRFAVGEVLQVKVQINLLSSRVKTGPALILLQSPRTERVHSLLELSLCSSSFEYPLLSKFHLLGLSKRSAQSFNYFTSLFSDQFNCWVTKLWCLKTSQPVSSQGAYQKRDKKTKEYSQFTFTKQFIIRNCTIPCWCSDAGINYPTGLRFELAIFKSLERR